MKYNHTQSGFSLVETLVAITILLLVIIGPMSISSQTAKSSSFASEQVTAFFLAQEGIELIQKGRDDLLVRSFASDATVGDLTPWATFTNVNGTFQNCFLSTGCGVEINTHGNTQSDLITPVSCSTITNCRLYRKESNVRSKFTHSSTGGVVATPFTRVVKLTRVNNDEYQVLSVVTWRTGSIRNEQKVEVASQLFNIYGN